MWCKDIFRCRMTMWIEHCIAGIPWVIYMDSLRRELLYPNTRSLRGWEHIGPSLISSVHILTSPGLSGVNMRMQSQSEYKLILLWVANISWGKIKINRPRQRSLDSINNASPYYTGNNTSVLWWNPFILGLRSSTLLELQTFQQFSAFLGVLFKNICILVFRYGL